MVRAVRPSRLILVATIAGAIVIGPLSVSTLPALTAAPASHPSATHKAGVVTILVPAVDDPTSLTRGPDGAMWFINTDSLGLNESIGRINATGTATHYTAKWVYPSALVLGPDHSLWFDNFNGIGSITAGGKLTRHGRSGVGATSMAWAGKNVLWYATGNLGGGGELGRITITPHGVTVRHFHPKGVTDPFDITRGPDGAMWFVNGNSIGRIDASGNATLYRGGFGRPNSLTVADHQIWFAMHGGVIRMTTHGALHFIHGAKVGLHPSAITAGSHGSVWFVAGPGTVDRISSKYAVTATRVKYHQDGVGLGGPPDSLTAGPGGSMWFTWTSARDDTDGLGRLSAHGHVTWFRQGLAGPASLASNGRAIWVSAFDDASVDRVSPADAETVFNNGPLDLGCTAGGGCISGTAIEGMAAGSDHSLWGYTGDDRLFHITASGSISHRTVKALNRKGDFVQGIAVGPDQDIWLVVNDGSQGGDDGAIVRVTPAGRATTYTGTGIANPTSITRGHDGAMWFTNGGVRPSLGGGTFGPLAGNSIGRIDQAGTVTTYAGTTGASAGVPANIASGPGHALWFTTKVGGKTGIGRITTGGVITDFVNSDTRSADSIAGGPDGALWFTAVHNVKAGTRFSIARITSKGVVTTYQRGFGDVDDIVAGPDHNMWFIDVFSNILGRITTSAG